jgi:hypothetical protein
MASLHWRKHEESPTARENGQEHGSTAFLKEGSLQYAVEKGENSNEPTYQEVSGAPVETRSPLGYVVLPIPNC